MKWILPAAILLLCYSCNNKGKGKQDTPPVDSTGVKHTDPPAKKIEPVKGTAADLPATLRLKGAVQEIWKWTDNSGENLLITTAVAPYNDKQVVEQYGEAGQSAELYAFHYIKRPDGQYEQLWMLTDAEKGCPFDLTCGFVKDAVSITDLDADGIAETTVLYKLACRSDVSPAAMKLIMHEGSVKYALRGIMWYGMPDAEFSVTEADANLETLPGYKGTDDEYMKTFGRYESEKDFAAAPPQFLSHARQQWIRFVKENDN